MEPTWAVARSTLTRRARRLKVGAADSRTALKAADVSDGSPAGRISARLKKRGRSGWGYKKGYMDTFNKRQKEMRRLDRQKEKAARRIQRKQNRDGTASDASSDDTPKAEPDSSATEERTNDV